MGGNIVLIGTLDTKGEESLFIKKMIENNNFRVITIDMGTGARGKLVFDPDYSREEIAKAGGSSMQEILSLGEVGQENRIIEIMSEGTISLCRQLYEEGKLNGIISLGGTMGTNLGTRVMRALPFGVPKVMLSTIASGDTSSYVSTKDIVMIPSIADIAGLNRITEATLTLAAGAVMGMAAARKEKPVDTSDKKLIGITTLGGTTNCALYIKKKFEEKGYEVVIFHSNGNGGKAMEEMIEQGLIQGVFDLSTNEVVDNLYQGWGDAGPTRMEVAGRKGIPQLIAPGNIDHIIYPSPDKIPDRFKHQYIHVHGLGINVLRTKKNEMIEVAKVISNKINNAKGKTAVIFPLKGLSVLDRVEKEFDDLEANLAFLNQLKQSLKPEIKIEEVDAHITEELFAEKAAEMLSSLLDKIA